MEPETLTTAKQFALSPGQVEAKEKVATWLKVARAAREAEIRLDEEPPLKWDPLFKLHGFAGTGKTTIIRALIEDQPTLRVKYAAFSGKAAMVMRRNGLPAGTIHSLIYKPIEPDKAKCNELFKRIRETADAGEKRRLQAELDTASKVTFDLRTEEESELRAADLLVLDECSMVNDEMLTDLKSFGVPILALGDPGQLPPIDGTGALVKGKPDVFLTEIHRQAADNPIIDFATRARNGVPIPYIQKGGSKKVQKYQILKEEILTSDQIITGKNVVRRDLNRRIRSLKGYSGRYPQLGEKLICLRNNKGLGIFNGMMGEVIEVGDLLGSAIELRVRMETGLEVKVTALRAHFDEYEEKDALKNVKRWEFKDNEEFDFGYAITVHKAQGSQWDNVILWDDGFLSWEPTERKKWLYTGITRAAQNIIIAA